MAPQGCHAGDALETDWLAGAARYRGEMAAFRLFPRVDARLEHETPHFEDLRLVLGFCRGRRPWMAKVSGATQQDVDVRPSVSPSQGRSDDRATGRLSEAIVQTEQPTSADPLRPQ